MRNIIDSIEYDIAYKCGFPASTTSHWDTHDFERLTGMLDRRGAFIPVSYKFFERTSQYTQSMDPWTTNLRLIYSPMLKSYLASGLSLPWIWLVKLKKTSLHGRCVTQVILPLRVFNLRMGIIHTLHDLSADLSSLIKS